MLPTLHFLSPLWLAAGAGAAALPILAHFLTLRRPRSVLFPGARFVRTAQAAATRRSRPRDMLLLALRVLAILLIAGAFAQPIIMRPVSEGIPAPLAEGMDHAIIIDASASMLRTRNGLTLFDQARSHAETVLDALNPVQDRAAIILAGARPHALLPSFTGNFAGLAAALADAQPSLEACDAHAAINLAGFLASPATHRRTLITVYSDFQPSQWTGVQSEYPISAGIIYADPATAGASIDELSISPSHPVVGAPVRITGVVTNRDVASRSISVTLVAPFGSQTLLITTPPGERRAAIFDIVPASAGPTPVTMSIPRDAFAYDDVRHAVVRVAEHSRAALITTSNMDDLSYAAAWVHAALSSRHPNEIPQSVLTLSARSASAAALTHFEDVLLVECGALDESSLDALILRLRTGLAVVWTLDSEASVASFERFLHRADVPFQPSNAKSPGRTPLTITSLDLPPLSLTSLSSIRFVAPVAAPTIPGAITLGSYSDGSPFILERSIGVASLIIVRADLAPGRSDFVRSPHFPVFVDALLRSARPASVPARAFHIGQSVTSALDAKIVESVPVTPHDSLGRPVVITPGGSSATARFAPLESPGLVSLSDEAGRILAMEAANLDPRESETGSLSEAQLAELSRSRTSDYSFTSAFEQPGAFGDQRMELWPIAMALALLALASESWAIWLWGARRPMKPSHPAPDSRSAS